MLTKKQISELRSKSKTLEPIARVGKNGFTENAVKEIDTFLRRKKLVKIKFLKGAAEGHDRKALAKELAEKTNSEVIDLVGFSVAIYRR